MWHKSYYRASSSGRFVTIGFYAAGNFRSDVGNIGNGRSGRLVYNVKASAVAVVIGQSAEPGVSSIDDGVHGFRRLTALENSHHTMAAVPTTGKHPHR